MTAATDYLPPPAPPLGRLWTDGDVCLYHGFSSIELLMKMPGFPTPLPYPFKGRRWRAEDHYAFTDSLAGSQPAQAEVLEALPALDPAEYWAQRDKERKAARRGKNG